DARRLARYLNLELLLDSVLVVERGLIRAVVGDPPRSRRPGNKPPRVDQIGVSIARHQIMLLVELRRCRRGPQRGRGHNHGSTKEESRRSHCPSSPPQASSRARFTGGPGEHVSHEQKRTQPGQGKTTATRR